MSTLETRIKLGHGPTPIEFLPRLTQVLGGPQIYIKRDDCTGLASGGNKTRKLEFLMADAINQKADIIVTVGGIQSNHARQTAAAAAKLGLSCHLILEPVTGTPKLNYQDNGNILLNNILGASIEICTDGDIENASKRAIDRFSKLGKQVYFIPMGGSNPIGAKGYEQCAKELVAQSKASFPREPWKTIYLATGSAGTQAGLLSGLIKEQDDTPVMGICVSRSTEEQNALVTSLLLEMDPNVFWQQRVHCDGNYVGDGYGIPNKPTLDAIRLVAQTEGILLDPVYTGKAMAGLIAHIAQNKFEFTDKILFIHTGGSAGLFGYASEF